MRCVEVAAAVLAEVLMQHDVKIDVETEIITWPMGVTSQPPQNKAPNAKGKGKGKATRTSASTTRGKNNVFGVLVNKVQAEQLENVKAQEIKQQASVGPSKTGTTSIPDNSTRDEAETEPEFVGTHQALPVKEANSKLKFIRL